MQRESRVVRDMLASSGLAAGLVYYTTSMKRDKETNLWEKVRADRVKLIGVADNKRLLQKHVVYIGIEGANKDRLFTCTLLEFVTQFEIDESSLSSSTVDQPVEQGSVVDMTSKGGLGV